MERTKVVPFIQMCKESVGETKCHVWDMLGS